MKQKGFSLIEIIVSIAIIAVIGLLSSTILSRTYRSSSQADLIGTLKQAGQQGVNMIESGVKNAETIICYYPQAGSPKKWMVVRTLDGKYTRYRFVDPYPLPPAAPTQNGYITKQENLNPAGINNFCKDTAVITGEVVLTDWSLYTGVSVYGQFIPIETGGKDTVTIKLDVGRPAGYTGPAGSPVPIQTTIRVRNETFR